MSYITNLHGCKWCTELKATSVAISVTELGPKPHIALPINLLLKVMKKLKYKINWQGNCEFLEPIATEVAYVTD